MTKKDILRSFYSTPMWILSPKPQSYPEVATKAKDRPQKDKTVAEGFLGQIYPLEGFPANY